MKNKFKLNVKCICGINKNKILFTYKKKPKNETDFKIKKNKYIRFYRKCLHCSHVFGDHKIDLSNLYDSAYLDSTYNNIDGMKKRFNYIMKLPFKKSDNKQRVKRILDFLKINSNFIKKTLLDVGAGTGVFAKSFINEKWNVETIEPDIRTVKYLNDLGIKSYCQDIRNFNKNRKYNLVTFNKVLEHVENPIELLKSTKKYMTKKSFLYVELPDMIASKYGKDREEFFIDHHHVFSISSATFLLEKSGFIVKKIERIVEPSGKFSIYLFASI